MSGSTAHKKTKATSKGIAEPLTPRKSKNEPNAAIDRSMHTNSKVHKWLVVPMSRARTLAMMNRP